MRCSPCRRCTPRDRSAPRRSAYPSPSLVHAMLTSISPTAPIEISIMVGGEPDGHLPPEVLHELFGQQHSKSGDSDLETPLTSLESRRNRCQRDAPRLVVAAARCRSRTSASDPLAALKTVIDAVQYPIRPRPGPAQQGFAPRYSVGNPTSPVSRSSPARPSR